MELSLSEAARLLGKSERKVRYLIRSGRMPARKIDAYRSELPSADAELADLAARQAETVAGVATVLEQALG